MSDKEGSQVTLRGYVRVCTYDKDGKLIEDTGFNQNTILAAGWQYMIYSPLSVADSGSRRLPQFGVLGSVANSSVINSAMASSSFTRLGLNVSQGAMSFSPSSVSTTNGVYLRLTAQWASNYVTGTAGNNINALAVYNATTSTTVPLSIVYFAASNWASDQAVRVTYDFRFNQS